MCPDYKRCVLICNYVFMVAGIHMNPDLTGRATPPHIPHPLITIGDVTTVITIIIVTITRETSLLLLGVWPPISITSSSIISTITITRQLVARAVVVGVGLAVIVVGLCSRAH